MSNWQKTQDRQLADHQKGADVFSRPNTLGVEKLGTILTKYLSGKTCLDAGCGILPTPGYMQLSPKVIYTGIDPYKGGERDFTFVQAHSEDMPFKNDTFDGVLFAYTIDHVIDPNKAVGEAHRVLKKGGYVIIWGTFRNPKDAKYQRWLKTRDLKIYNHPWAFTDKSIIELFYQFNLIETICINHKHRIFVLQKHL